MKRKATARWRVHLTRGWLRTGLSLCALLALLSMLALFTSGGPLPVQIAAVPQGGAVYLLEEWEDLCLLAYGGSEAGSGAVMALDRRTGQAASQTGFSGRLVWACRWMGSARRCGRARAFRLRRGGAFLLHGCPRLPVVF